MSAARGLAGGFLGLTLTQALLSNSKGAENAGSLFGLAAAAINRLVNPSVPLIPDRRT